MHELDYVNERCNEFVVLIACLEREKDIEAWHDFLWEQTGNALCFIRQILQQQLDMLEIHGIISAIDHEPHEQALLLMQTMLENVIEDLKDEPEMWLLRI